MESKSFFPVETDIFRANNKASAFIKQFNDLERGAPRIFVKYDKARNGYYFEPNPDYCFHHKNSPWQVLLEWERANIK